MNGHTQNFMDWMEENYNIFPVYKAHYCAEHNQYYKLECIGCHLGDCDVLAELEDRKEEKDRHNSFDYDEKVDNELSFNL